MYVYYYASFPPDESAEPLARVGYSRVINNLFSLGKIIKLSFSDRYFDCYMTFLLIIHSYFCSIKSKALKIRKPKHMTNCPPPPQYVTAWDCFLLTSEKLSRQTSQHDLLEEFIVFGQGYSSGTKLCYR